MMDAHGSMCDCYVGQVMDDGHVDLLGEPAERYETYEEVK